MTNPHFNCPHSTSFKFSTSFVIVNQCASSTTWPKLLYILGSRQNKRDIKSTRSYLFMYQIYKWKSKGWFPILRDELWNGINYTSCSLHKGMAKIAHLTLSRLFPLFKEVWNEDVFCFGPHTHVYTYTRMHILFIIQIFFLIYSIVIF